MVDLISAACLVMMAILLYLVWRVATIEQRLNFYEALLKNARTESRIAHGLAQTTNRLIESAVNGAAALRNLRGDPSDTTATTTVATTAATTDPAVAPSQPGLGAVEMDLLVQRIRHRQAVEAMGDAAP